MLRAVPHRRGPVWRYLYTLRNGIGLITFGALLGGGGFLVFDSLQPAKAPRTLGSLSPRAPYYATCREAFQDGRANIRQGEPGYRAALDADHDGLACEPYRGRLRN